MGLYPITVFEYPAPRFQNTLAPGTLGVVPLTLAPGGTLTLTMNQMQLSQIHLVQDRSILGWVSTQQSGNPVVESPINVKDWHLTSLQKTIILLYDVTADLGPFELASIGLLPGDYWLNVLNLVNETNSFFFEIS